MVNAMTKAAFTRLRDTVHFPTIDRDLSLKDLCVKVA